MRLMQLAYFSLISIMFKLLYVDAFLFSPGRIRLLNSQLETNRKLYSKFLQNEKKPNPISLDEAQKLWNVMMKAIKQSTVKQAHQHDYWLLRQG